MHIKLLRKLLDMLCEKNESVTVLLTDGNCSYQIVDICRDDKNPYLYIEIESAE